MRVPGTPAQAMPQVEMPSPTMFAMAASIMDSHGKFNTIVQEAEAAARPKFPHSDYDRDTILIAPQNPDAKAKKFMDDAKGMHEDLNASRQPDLRIPLRTR